MGLDVGTRVSVPVWFGQRWGRPVCGRLPVFQRAWLVGDQRRSSDRRTQNAIKDDSGKRDPASFGTRNL